MNFWGITGTNGKTTATWILAEFLNAAPGRKCGYITTVEVFDGKDRFYTGYTTPPLARLKEIYAAMEANGCTDCAMEVSSHAIHQNRVGFGTVTKFSGGAFTNLSEDHLDYHRTMEEYFRVKLSFAERIADSAETQPCMGRRDLRPFVVCLDGGYGNEMLRAAGRLPLNVLPVSFRSPRFDLSDLKLAGDYNKSNVLVAAALAEAAGVPHETVQSVIPSLEPRWGRLELVENPAVAAKVYVDFAHTPDGLEKVLTAARGFTPEGRKLWVVFGAGGDRDPMKRPLMGEVCARLADRVIVTSDNPRSENPAEIIRQILAGCGAPDGESRIVAEPDRARAIAHALEYASKGDVVIIAGKGHETTQEIAGVKHPFDDREAVRRFQDSVMSDFNGWIDLQVNGYGGVDFNAPGLTAEAVRTVTERLEADGTVGYMPTLVTGDPDVLIPVVRTIVEARRRYAVCEKNIIGIFMEGPFISDRPGAVGTHPVEWVRAPDMALFNRFQDAAEGLVRMVNVAAEIPGMPGFVRSLRSAGVTVTLGHQLAASPEDLEPCIAAGATAFTHLGNGIPNSIPRHVNTITTALVEDRASIMFIPDGHHLPDTMLKLYTRAVPVKRLVAVSDAQYPAGMAPGWYEVCGAHAKLEENGLLWNPERNCLVGATTPIAKCMDILSERIGLTPGECRAIGRDNPLKLIGLGG